ncbi:MAG: hypothetical protein E6371_14795 [Terrisporobacter othiniensis]|uniref:hypothetical protein n=1 Tax=Terrisporobacter othiniensis TaxID=1577792 RepID=UPI00290950A3|nr:hypothetical protein [Terrisporobacter othiniensis]MDU6985677.1 hypothetical protein [Terrisporobacter othiniensis]
MRQLVENLFWILVIILGSSYLLFIEFKNYKNRRRLKLKIKYTEENIVNMKIINKNFSKGVIMKVGGDIFPSKLPDTYMVELEYKGSKYEINDKEIFNLYNIGQNIKLKLVESLDENKNIVKYDLFKLK